MSDDYRTAPEIARTLVQLAMEDFDRDEPEALTAELALLTEQQPEFIADVAGSLVTIVVHTALVSQQRHGHKTPSQQRQAGRKAGDLLRRVLLAEADVEAEQE